MHISVITLGELMTWARRAGAPARRLQGIEELIRDLAVLDVSKEIASEFGSLRAALLDSGRPTPDMDLMIAATAIVHGLTLVTHNVSDFAHIPGLSIEDWLQP